ncbi:competence/damage-inducible protein A [Indioceanicola profundi]|uniref:competence/damage-inducible protein A n=1 Tax=Indioceanicola profundi TaxID=2220096 RepID=UPI000E6ABB86|nr:competence/damage-inducible protein A [Indioceanicola profundi]
MSTESSAQAPTAALLIIGNEILSGRTQDANLIFIAKYLGGIGVRLREVRVVPDDEAEIVAAVNALRARYTYLFTTGGIGPTHDDITSECIAKAFGVPLIQHPEARRRLEAHYADSGLLNEARLRMANTPKGAVLIDNPVSTAPGFQIGNVFVMAGVPSIMQAMLTGLGDRLAGGPPVLSRTVVCAVPEGTLAAGLGAVQAEFPDVDIGSYPAFRLGQISTSLVLRGTDPVRLDAAAERVAALVTDLGGTPEIAAG